MLDRATAEALLARLDAALSELGDEGVEEKKAEQKDVAHAQQRAATIEDPVSCPTKLTMRKPRGGGRSSFL